MMGDLSVCLLAAGLYDSNFSSWAGTLSVDKLQAYPFFFLPNLSTFSSNKKEWPSASDIHMSRVHHSISLPVSMVRSR